MTIFGIILAEREWKMIDFSLKNFNTSGVGTI